MIKGAIFDLDGTLLDSMWIWDNIGEAYLRSIGYEPKENLTEAFRTFSLYQAACYYKSEYGVTLSVDEIMNGINSMVEKYYENDVVLKSGADEFLNRLQKIGVRMCIATATDKYLVEAALKRCRVDGYFSDIFTCTSVGHGKDEPDIYRAALNHLGTDKSDTVVFEDSLFALKTAKADGFITAAVADCHEKNQSELRSLADCYITDYSDTEQFFNRSIK